MPIRNPFTRRPGAPVVNDENLHPTTEVSNGVSPPGFERVDTVGSKASSAMSVRSSKGQDNGEYKMSVVNDSGVYLPPSPTEEKGVWPRKYLTSRTSTDTRSSMGDIEPFSISRESFDSYRRSFVRDALAELLETKPKVPKHMANQALVLLAGHHRTITDSQWRHTHATESRFCQAPSLCTERNPRHS
jgi:hypothetical protein